MDNFKRQFNGLLARFARLAGFASAMIVVVLIAVSAVSASFTPQINYQGKLTDASGNTVADGDYNLRFKLCPDSACLTVLFDESFIGANKVTITDGLFSVMIGSVSTTLNTIDFNQTLYLEVNVGGTGTPSFETLLPRKILGAVPNAFNALKFDGLATTSFLRSDLSNTSAIITNATFTQATTSNFYVSGNIGLNNVYISNWSELNDGTFSTTSADYWDTTKNRWTSDNATTSFNTLITPYSTQAYNSSTFFTLVGWYATSSQYLTTTTAASTYTTQASSTATYLTIANASATYQPIGSYENPLTFTYPLQRTVNAISLAFGTTTDNTWAGTQTFTNLPAMPLTAGYTFMGSASNLAVATSSLFISSDGNVGIGTTTPMQKLEVAGNILINNSTNLQGYYMYRGGSEIWNISGSNYDLTLDSVSDIRMDAGTATNALFVQVNTGNVGIGTTTPDSMLQVGNATSYFKINSGNATTTGYLTVGSAPVGANYGAGDLNVSDAAVIGTTLSAGTSTLTNLIVTNFTTSTFAGGLTVGTSQFVVQQSNGYVGIGTTPSYPLHVVGTTTATNFLSTASTNIGSYFWRNNTDLNDGSPTYGIGLSTVDLGGGATKATRISDYYGLIFSTANTDRMVIDRTNGYVGIGTTTPDYKLTVNTGGLSVKDTATNLGGFTVSSNARIATFSGLPSGTTLATASLVVNPAGSGDVNRLLFGVGHTNVSRFTIDVEGDTYALGNLTVAGTGNSSFAGNVGIGTTTPATSLSIFNNSTAKDINIGVIPASTNYNAIWLNGGITASNYNILSSAADQKLLLNRPTEQDIEFRENNGTAQMIIKGTTGNIGIGTSTPQALLHLATTGNRSLTMDGTGTFNIYNSNLSTYASSNYSFNVGGTAALTILGSDGTTDGYVGIGTTTPDSILNLVGADPVLLIKDTDTSQSTANATLRLAESGAGGVTENYWDVAANPTGGQHFFNISRNAATPFLTINTSGNVGIGTTTPSVFLHVLAGGTGLSAPTDENPVAIFQQSANTGMSAAVYLIAGNNSTASGYYFGDTDANIGGIIYKHSTNLMSFRTNNTSDQMVIDSAGYVGIGTTTPDSALQVGNATSYFKINSGNATTTGYLTVGSAPAGAQFGAGDLNVSDDIAVGGSVSSTALHVTGNGTTTGAFNVGGILTVGTFSPTNLLVSSNATTSGYLTVGTAPSGANYGVGDLNVSDAVVIGGTLSVGTTTMKNLIVQNNSTSTFAGGLTVGGTDLVVQLSTGYVGIGMSSPNTALNVSSSIALTRPGANPGQIAAVEIGPHAPSGVAGGGSSLFINTPGYNTFSSGLGIDGTFTSPTSLIRLHAYGVKSAGYYSNMAFYTTNGTAESEVMRLDRNGYVGIATTTPANTLDVYGNASFGTGGSTADGVITFQHASVDEWTMGNDATDDTFVLASGSTLGGGFDKIKVRSTDGKVLINETDYTATVVSAAQLLVATTSNANVAIKMINYDDTGSTAAASIGAFTSSTDNNYNGLLSAFGSGFVGSNPEFNKPNGVSLSAGTTMSNGLSIVAFNGDIRFVAAQITSPKIRMKITSTTGAVIIASNASSTFVSTTVRFLVRNDSGSWGAVNSSTGAWMNSSDIRLKKNVIDLEDSLAKVMNLRPVRFDWNWDGNNEANIGFVAQEMQNVLPEFVDEGLGGYLGVSYAALTPVLAGAIQEQQKQINVLKSQISSSTNLAVSQSEPQQNLAVTDQDPYFNSLRVAGATTFYGTITVIGEAGFESKVVFNNEVEFNGHITVDQDTAGTITIATGTTSTIVRFIKPYNTVPKIMAVLNDDDDSTFMNWKIKDKTTSTFMIVLDKTTEKNVSFDWFAVAVKGQVAGVEESIVPLNEPTPPPIIEPVIEGDVTTVPAPIEESSSTPSAVPDEIPVVSEPATEPETIVVEPQVVEPSADEPAVEPAVSDPPAE